MVATRSALSLVSALIAVVACSDGPTNPRLDPQASFATSGPQTVSIASNFNGTPISAGTTIWFNAVVKVNGLPTNGATVSTTNGAIQFTANGTSYTLPVPPSTITFSASATQATTIFDNTSRTWRTTVPASYSGNVFLGSLAYQAPTGFPGGINPVTWSIAFTSSTSGLSIDWKWAAAVYTQFATDNNAIGVKPIDGSNFNPYANSDHAGTPENEKASVIGGARGGGGSNWTGSYSGTGSGAITFACNCWSTRASMPTPRMNFAVGVVNGILYAVGGLDVNGNGPLGTVEAYDPATNSWTTKTSMPTPRGILSVGVVNGILYAVGGGDRTGLLGGPVEAYDPAADSWTTKASLPTPRAALTVGVVNGILYAVGGGVPSGTTGANEAYDPGTNTWTTKASMPTLRAYLAGGVVNGIVYAVGGSDNSLSNETGVNEAYDPATDSWTTKASMPTPRGDLSVGVVNGILNAVGGRLSGGVPATATVEAYQP